MPVLLPFLFLRPRSRSSYQILFYFVLVVASTVGALAPLLGLAAVEGTIQQVQQRITGIGSYIDISRHEIGYRPLNCDQAKTISTISAVPHVLSVAPYLVDYAIIEANEDSRQVTVRAIDPESEARTSRLSTLLSHDALIRLGNKGASHIQALVGLTVARALNLNVGDSVALTHPGGGVAGHPQTALDGVVVGIFHSGLPADNTVILPISDMEKFADVPPGCVTGFSVLTDNIATSGPVALLLNTALGPEFNVTNWTERFPLYNQTILVLSRLTNLLTTVILITTITAITAIAMLVSYSKRRDFATLFALGLSIRQIRLAHVFLALTIGFVGYSLAALSAPFICHYCNSSRAIQIPGSLDIAFVSFSLQGKHFLRVAAIELCFLIPLGWFLPQSLGTSFLTRILRDE